MSKACVIISKKPVAQPAHNASMKSEWNMRLTAKDGFAPPAHLRTTHLDSKNLEKRLCAQLFDQAQNLVSIHLIS